MHWNGTGTLASIEALETIAAEARASQYTAVFTFLMVVRPVATTTPWYNTITPTLVDVLRPVMSAPMVIVLAAAYTHSSQSVMTGAFAMMYPP